MNTLKFRMIALMLFMLAITAGVFAQDDEPLSVVASYSILADVITQVAGDAANVSTLIGVGQDPHTYVPLTSDLVTLSDADVVFTNGAFFEEGLLESIENVETDVPIIEVSACVPILPFADLHGDEHGDEDHAEDEHGDEGHAEDEHGDEDHAGDEHGDEGTDAIAALCANHFSELGIDHETAEEGTLGLLYELSCDGHGHGEDEDGIGCDPHVWMNPENVILWTLYIRDSLITLDPSNEGVYRDNANTYVEQLRELIAEIEPAVASVPEENRVLVTNHEALGYFTDVYGFELIDAVLRGGSTTAEPSAADLAALIETIRESNVPALFAETTVNSSLINTVAAEVGTDVYELYTGSLSDEESGASTYLDYIRYNVSIIVNALGGNAEF